MARLDPRVAACLAWLAAGCAANGLGVVPRYPFVEDRGLALVDEVLKLSVQADGSVQVDALFHFVAEGSVSNRVLTFPIAGPRGPARGFSAELVGSSPARVPVAPGGDGGLPMGEVAEYWDIWLDGAALAEHDGRLQVRYSQLGTGDFGYVLKSGAYWRGPIRRLEVIVEDPHARLAAVLIEGQRHPVDGRPILNVTLADVEPSDGVRLEPK